MNLSGKSVSEVTNFFKIPSKNVFVFYDELDLDVGKIKFKNRTGRFHLTGITFSSSQWEGTEGTGMIHPTQITKQGSGNGLDSDKLDGQQGTYYLNYNNFLATKKCINSYIDLNEKNL